MKICFFGDADSIHIHRWCKHFAGLGHEVSLISFKKASIEGISCYQVHDGEIRQEGGNWRVLFSYRRVKSLVRKIQPDIFHSMYATSYGITGALTKYKPYVITALGSDVLVSPKTSRLYKVLLRFAFRRATWITAMADHMKQEIENLGVPASKVDTVPFGIDPSIFHSENRRVFDGTLRIISTRNFEEVYNIPHLLKALVELKKRSIPFRLTMIGAGSLLEEFKEFIRSNELNEEIQIVGKKTQSEIAELLRQSDVFVSVSKSDGNNISLNEAMACGNLCIATIIPANTQWISHGENGFLVQIDDILNLADLLENAYHNFNAIQEKALPLNKKIIEEKAIWAVNMKKVEQKYTELIHAR